MATEEPDNDGDDEDDPGPIEGSPVRPPMTGHRVLEMDAIGWAIFIALLVIMIPLLPLIALLIVITRLLGWGRGRTVSWG